MSSDPSRFTAVFYPFVNALSTLFFMIYVKKGLSQVPSSSPSHKDRHIRWFPPLNYHSLSSGRAWEWKKKGHTQNQGRVELRKRKTTSNAQARKTSCNMKWKITNPSCATSRPSNGGSSPLQSYTLQHKAWICPRPKPGLYQTGSESARNAGCCQRHPIHFILLLAPQLDLLVDYFWQPFLPYATIQSKK